jgi:hypothetical protein
MMTEPKPLASLSSTLLARKGQAKPAMRPQGFAGFGMAAAHAAHDDLGWNDMGFESAQPSADIVPIHAAVEAETPASVPAPAVVHQQHQALERELAPSPVVPQTVAPKSAKAVRAAPGSKGKLRLDPERHLQLRLVCAIEHRSAQQVVIAALDAFLNNQPALAQLAASKTSPKR